MSATATTTILANPVDLIVSQIHCGRVTHGTVRSRLPECVRGHTWFTSSARRTYQFDILSAIAAVASRVAPWVRVLAGPTLWSRLEGQDDTSAFSKSVRLASGVLAYEIGGEAWCREHVPPGNPEIALICVDRSQAAVLSTLHHELAHIVLDYWLTADDLAAVNDAIVGGVQRPGDYLASACERRARIYQSWANAWDEGWRPLMLLGRPVRRLDRIFHYVHSGRLARDVARYGAARSQCGACSNTWAWVRWLIFEPRQAPTPLERRARTNKEPR